MVRTRRFFETALLVLLLGALLSCGKSEPIKVGFVGGLSGRVADLGIGGRNGATIAVEERNAAGGVKGRLVELVVRNDEQDPKVALQAVEELIALPVQAIVGHTTSAMSVTTVGLVTERKMVMVSPTSTADELSQRDDYFFRVVAATRENAARNAGSENAPRLHSSPRSGDPFCKPKITGCAHSLRGRKIA